MDCIVESALLVHGIRGLTNEDIWRAWSNTKARIAWMEQGEIVIGDIDRFLDFRARMFEGPVRPGMAEPKEAVRIAKMTGKTKRANHFNLDAYCASGADAVLTASGAMSICAREGIPVAVTAGMGGFFPEMLYGEGEILVTKGDGPPDVATLTALDVCLLTSGPKDMLDCEGTFRYLEQHGVPSMGLARDTYTGYIFVGEPARLTGTLQCGGSATVPEQLAQAATALTSVDGKERRSALIINEIPEDRRVPNPKILETAIAYGLEAEKQGAYYHPAVNAKIEQLTAGESARMQLEALAANAQLAERL